jgi:hypothetical protein
MPTDYDPFRGYFENGQKPEAAKAPDAGEPEKPQEPQQEEVKSGTSREVLGWVGDDKDRARRALEKEQASDKPRSTLIRELNEVLEEDK